jgi:uncharacterized protein YfkK (UPF0435 family)
MKRNHNSLGLSSTSLFTVTVVAITFFLILILIYSSIFLFHYITPSEMGNFDYSKSDLGTLGDLVGGILNPLLTFITIGLLIWSIRVQGRELTEATEQSRRSADALVQTNRLHNNNFEEQRRIVMIPHLMGKLTKEASFLYQMYREKNSIEIHERSKTQVGDKNILRIDVPSLGSLVICKGLLNKSDFHLICKDINLPQQKDEVLKEIRLKLNICTQSIFEISDVCEKLKDIEAPTILYKEEINQARAMSRELNEITEALGSLGMEMSHVRFNLSESEKHNHILSPRIVIMNHSNEGKPFMFIYEL